jgi:hypothetical protein
MLLFNTLYGFIHQVHSLLQQLMFSIFLLCGFALSDLHNNSFDFLATVCRGFKLRKNGLDIVEGCTRAVTIFYVVLSKWYECNRYLAQFANHY